MTGPLVLAAHGSADPRSTATTFEIAEQIRRLRPRQDVRVGFCEHSTPNLRDVLGELDGPAVVTPLLLASAYHARVDIPAMIRESGADAVRAEALGEDPRLVQVMRERLAEHGIGSHDNSIGVLVVAVGSSHAEANTRTSTVAVALTPRTRWSGAMVAYATGPEPTVTQGIELLRQRGAQRVVLAPWFIAPGVITDRVAELARAAGVEMSAPLGAHRLVAETVLDRFDQAVSARVAA